MTETERSILAVFAHPDDEAFGTAGTMYRYHAMGVRTALVCATRGEAGEISDPSLATPDTLGMVREQELRSACRIMGITDLAFLDYHDGQLANADPYEATGRIVAHIRRVRPQVMVTFDANGGYGHLDHMAIHRLTVAAFAQAGDPACYPEQLEDGIAPYSPQKLYAGAFPRSVMAGLREKAAEQGISFSPGGNAATIPLEEMGTPDDRVTCQIVLTDEEFEVKMEAMRAHKTQMDPRSPFSRLPDAVIREWLGSERFSLLHVQRGHSTDSQAETIPSGLRENDLFDGVTED